MAQLTVELNAREMAQLSAAARTLRIDPSRLTRLQLFQLLATSTAPRRQKARRQCALARRRTALPLHVKTWLSAIKNFNKLRARRQSAIVTSAAANETRAAADSTRAKRRAAIMSVHGMWAGDPDKPRDAVEYQREVRAEWPSSSSTPTYPGCPS